jgi:hypothetical protein
MVLLSIGQFLKQLFCLSNAFRCFFRYGGVLSAYGLSLADAVNEQEPTAEE